MRRLLITATVPLLMLLQAGFAAAAGMATHAFMADLGRNYLPDGELRRLLDRQRATLLAGAMYPDGGYFTGQQGAPEEMVGNRDIAEHAHWGIWANHFIEYIRDDLGCVPAAPALPGELGNPPASLNLTDTCARLIAFMLGNAAHGLGDEVWDDLFEPQVREQDELPFHGPVVDGAFGPFSPPDELRAVLGQARYDYLAGVFSVLNNIEYGMDMIAIVEHNLYDDNPVLEFPPTSHLQQVYAKAGLEFSVQAIELAAAATRGAMTAQRAGTAIEYPRVRMTMPWASAHYYTESGGVVDSAQMIAGMYQQLWNKLTGAADPARQNQPVPSWIVGVHPENGEVDVPGEYGLADNRVRAWLGNYVQGTDQQPNFFLRLQGDDEPPVAGRLDVGIYGGDKGDTHSLRFDPDISLTPGKRYTATISKQVVDDRGMTLEEKYSWWFRTAKTASPLCNAVRDNELHQGEMAQKCSR